MLTLTPWHVKETNVSTSASYFLTLIYDGKSHNL